METCSEIRESDIGNFPSIPLSGINNLVADRYRDRMRSIDCAKLAGCICQMLLGCPLGKVQDLSDLPRRFALRCPGDHFALPLCQPRRRLGCRLKQIANTIKTVH